MRILVIGSHGFIGSYACTALQALGEVYTADVVGMGPRHVLLDRQAPDLDAVLANAQPDVCVNCAGAANVAASFDDVRTDYLLNVELVRRLLEAIRCQSLRTRFINLSSAAVYGNPLSNPIGEQAPLAPISPYGWHKLQAEQLCLEYSTCFGIDTLSLRLFSVFGPGLRKQMYWDIFQRMRGNEVLTCPGTGEETRDYIHVEDVVAAIRVCMAHATFDGRAINVASGMSTSVRDAVETLIDKLGWQGRLEFDGGTRGGDPLHWRADIGMLNALGYRPVFDYERGITDLAKWLNILP